MPYIKQTWVNKALADDALCDIEQGDTTSIDSDVSIDLATDVITAGANVTAE